MASPILLSPQNSGNPSTIEFTFPECLLRARNSAEELWGVGKDLVNLPTENDICLGFSVRKADTRSPLEWLKVVAVLFLLLTGSKGRTGLGV